MSAPQTLPPFQPAPALRSEAFAEDLFELSDFAAGSAPGPGGSGTAARGVTLASVVLCGVPVLLALLGGALAFWQATVG